MALFPTSGSRRGDAIFGVFGDEEEYILDRNRITEDKNDWDVDNTRRFSPGNVFIKCLICGNFIDTATVDKFNYENNCFFYRDLLV